MEEIIKKLQSEKESLINRVRKIDKFIVSFMDICPHKNEDGSDAMQHEGNDSHKDYYKCRICGKTERR
jgi:hypothetical protein